ncbi:MAG: hemolysin family protein [Proteobacteria bacterium]|nr:hemolysin family protein [Pseudomonadota bacterium]
MESVSSELIELISIIICFFISGFLSCTETSVTTLDPLKVRHILASQGDRARSLQFWKDYPDRVLATILIFNNLVNILASALATNIAMTYFENNAVAIATGVMTFLILIFCEIIPKSFGKTHAEQVAIPAMWVINILYRVTSPVVRLFSGFAGLVIDTFSGQSKSGYEVTEEQLEFMVNESQRTGAIKGMKKNIIEGAFEFDEIRASEIITPRTSMCCLPDTSTYQEVLDLMVETGYSRIPIYKEKLDQIVGIVLLKDIMTASSEALKRSTLQVKDFMRKPFFAPESKTIMRLFVDLQRTKNHLAIIIDEYGGTLGLVTMEDILEEIFGEIQDEHDEEDPYFVKIRDHTWLVYGGVSLDDFEEFFELPSSDHDADTLAGWITDMTKEMPQIGQAVNYEHLKIQITEVEQRRVLRVSVEDMKRKEKNNNAETPIQSFDEETA